MRVLDVSHTSCAKFNFDKQLVASIVGLGSLIGAFGIVASMLERAQSAIERILFRRHDWGHEQDNMRHRANASHSISGEVVGAGRMQPRPWLQGQPETARPWGLLPVTSDLPSTPTHGTNDSLQSQAAPVQLQSSVAHSITGTGSTTGGSDAFFAAPGQLPQDSIGSHDNNQFSGINPMRRTPTAPRQPKPARTHVHGGAARAGAGSARASSASVTVV
jgi:hypothetical protein